MSNLQAPFPWFGGKSRIAPVVWSRFGAVSNYVEPFFGSGAVLLARPQPFIGPETINDLDGFVANAWRAIQHDPAAVAHHADWPVNEVDLHARHAWLVTQRQDLTARLLGDPAYFDARIAGWWIWGQCAWIGSGWCSGQGPWQAVDGRLVDTRVAGERQDGQGIRRQRPHLWRGLGINRQLPHLGDAGQGINRQLAGAASRHDFILAWLQALADRLREVRVCCGDWSRVLGPTPTVKQAGITGVLLDPPYADTAGRDSDLYACDSLSVAHAVLEWAIAQGDDPRLRIALCGYDGEHDMPARWTVHAWSTQGGYNQQGPQANKENRHRERVWFSPHCLVARKRQQGLFDEDPPARHVVLECAA
jgi:hypothetical protein